MMEKYDSNHNPETARRRLEIMTEAAHLLNSTIEYEELLKNVLKLVTRAVDAEAALVYRYNRAEEELRVRFYSGDQEPTVMSIKLDQGFVGWVAKNNQPVLTNDPMVDSRYNPEITDEQGVEFHSLICYPLMLRGEFFGVIEAINKTTGQFDQTDLETFDLLSDQIAVAIHNAFLYRNARSLALQRTTLYEVSKQLSHSLTLDEVLHNILTALKKVVDFTAGSVYLIDDKSGAVDTITSVGYDSAVKADLHLKIGEGIVGDVARTGEAQVVPDTSKDDRYITARHETRSEIVVPILSDGKMIGALNLEHDYLDAFSGEDQEILSAFASQAAISIERARMHKFMLDQKKMDEQLSIARAIQNTFLPNTVPSLRNFDLWGANIPSGEVGGDYYDFIQIVENQVGIAIADVSGKGIPASLIMASFRASLIAEIRNNYAIRTICRKVNNLLCESLEPENFVTAIYGVLDAKNAIFTFSNCGHNPGLILRADNSVEELGEGGIILGIRPDSKYEERPIYFNDGDILCLFTDGVTEAENAREEQYETDRLIETITRYRHLSAAEIGAKIIESVRAFSHSGIFMDDLTLIILKRPAASA
ncbi:MAG: SpoIIE family protein phosphatase [FCB group bacterium]|nr:SpoIIE family protein phosphatase [FCB group bacterium]